jgi:hypothetical protein
LSFFLPVPCQHPNYYPILQIASGVRVPLAPIIDGGDISSTMSTVLSLSSSSSQNQTEANELLLVCGSFYILADVRKALGMHDIVDTFDLHERTTPAVKSA